MVENIAGVILAGGTGRRLGGCIKPKILVNGEVIIDRILNTIRDLFSEIIIVTNSPEEFGELGHCRIVPDLIKDSGPLGGIHAGLIAANNKSVFVIAGDMPYISKTIITAIIDESEKHNNDIIIPRIGELIEPLHAIYRQSCRERLESFLGKAESFAVRDFIRTLNVLYYELQNTDETEMAFRNINLPSDL